MNFEQFKNVLKTIYRMKRTTYNEIRSIIFNAELDSYENLNDEELIWLLKSEVAEERAIAAKLLGDRGSMAALPFICKRLATEKEKYISIIMVEALKMLTTSESFGKFSR